MPRSPELSTFAVLLAAGGGMIVMGGTLVDSLERIMRAGLTLDRASAFDAARMTARLYEGAAAALVGFAPLFLLVALAAILAPLLVSGWLFTFQALQPDFSRLNPINGLKRILSWHGAIELGKALLKTLVIGGVAAWVVWSERAEIVSLLAAPVEPGLVHLGGLLGRTFLAVAGAFALIVAVDVPFQIWDHHRQLRMTREEVRQELKETEGDPQLKARIRSLQREVARRRMMAEVPKADVVVTNPDHYAVALRYNERRDARAARGRQGLAAWSPSASPQLASDNGCRSCARRPWRARCSRTPRSARRFPARCTTRWRRCWRGSTSCGASRPATANARPSRRLCQFRPSSIPSQALSRRSVDG